MLTYNKETEEFHFDNQAIDDIKATFENSYLKENLSVPLNATQINILVDDVTIGFLNDFLHANTRHLKQALVFLKGWLAVNEKCIQGDKTYAQQYWSKLVDKLQSTKRKRNDNVNVSIEMICHFNGACQGNLEVCQLGKGLQSRSIFSEQQKQAARMIVNNILKTTINDLSQLLIIQLEKDKLIKTNLFNHNGNGSELPQDKILSTKRLKK